MRYERSVTIYADAPIIKRFQANETSISIAQGKISALISESEWIELQNSSKTMYSQLASAVLELDALTLNFSDMTAKYNGLSDQFTDLDSKVAEYKIGIDGISSNLTSVQQSLQNNYSTTIETNAAIKASIDELSSLISKDYVTNSEFGSLTIGSVNMLRNSDFAQQSRYWTAQGITVQYGSDTTVGTYARISSTAAGSTDHRLYQTTESFSHESNVEYTLSFWAKASVNTDIKAGHINQLSTFGIGTDWKRYNATYKVGSTGSFTVYPISSNVTLYITKIKIEKGSKLTDWTPAPADINELIGIEGDSAVSESNKYTNNKLTAYSTTSQVNSAINQKADEITTSVSATYATKASVTDVKEEAINSANSNTANLLKSYSTTAQMNSAISQKANEITTSVSETYATKTSVTTAKNEAITAAQGYADDAEEAANSHTDNLLKSYSTTTQMNSAISQKADEITATVAKTYMTQADFNNMKLGGRNLIRNSTGLLGTLNWENRFLDYSLLTKDGDALLRKSGQLLIFKRNISGSAATISAVTNNSYPTQQHSAFSLGNTTTGEKYVYSARFSLKASTTYTMSGYVYVSAGAKGIDILVLGDYSITDLNSQYVTYDKAYSILTYTTTGQWYYFTKTFTTDASTKSGIVRVDHNGVSSSGSTAKILFGNLKLEESNDKVTDWTPAPEDDTDYTDGKLKAYSTTVEMQSAINQKANEISMTVSQTYTTVKEFDDYKNTADVQYTTISSKYTQLADKFTWVVSGGTSSSNFTITSRLAELVANDINLHGRVTFSGLDSSAQGKINTAQSTANSAQSTANSVQSTVNSNKSKWDNAASWTSSNGSNMTNLRNMVLKWTDNAVSTTTQINGGWIKTNTITADKIAANAIVSSKIAAGAITADKINVSSLESISARIGGWTISGNNLMDDKTNFMVRIAAPTEYGGDGNGNADVLVVKDKTNGTFPLVISSNGQVLATRCKFEGGTIGGWKITGTDIYNDNGASSAGIGKAGTTFAFWAGATYANRNDPYIAIGHAGEFFIKDYLTYLPNGMGYDPKVKMTMGGWQIKTGTNAWGYDHFEYWDTIETQENGICAHGPWVVWGGWNGGPSVNVENYKFVVTDQGVCKAMSWVTGSRAEWKENIVPYHKSALQEIMNSDVYYYNLKDKGRGAWQEGRHIGFVIGDQYNVSSDILDGSGGSIDMYSALAIAYKAIQEQQQEIEMLKNKLQQS